MDYIEEALLYERAISRINRLIPQLRNEQREDDLRAAREGEQKDKSFDLVVKLLDESRGRCLRESNRLWSIAEEAAEVDAEDAERLVCGIAERVVLDYETLLSRGITEGRAEMEGFFAGTNLDYLPGSVRWAHHQLKKIIKEHGKEISAETAEERRKKHCDFRFTKYRCPMCKRGLYESGKPQNGVHTIRCSGCNMEGQYYD